MAITNQTIQLKRKSSTGTGSFGKTLLGSYDVWLEGLDTKEQRNVGGITNERAIPHGLIFLFDDVDLTDCFITTGSVDYPVISFDRFLSRNGDFHHIEALFSK